MAGLYDGHILEQALIRVDCFTCAPKLGRFIPSINPDKSLGPKRRAPNAQLFLLTHIHSDHLTGLTEDFTGLIICTPDTKRMLLRLEYERERDYARKGIRDKPRRKYAGLSKRLIDAGTSNERVVDRIRTIEYGNTTTSELGYEDGKPTQVNITAFLIQGDGFAVVHTGDIRCDASWLKALRSSPHPALTPFLHDPGPSWTIGRINVGSKRLDRVYLDTSALWVKLAMEIGGNSYDFYSVGTGDMPSKEDVIRGLIEKMQWYPPDTVFFMNTWTWGWESVLRSVSSAFGQPVCIDRYKASVYKAVLSDPDMLAMTTRDPHATRFHACERYDRCAVCGHKSDRLVVNVVMVEVKSADWEITKASFLDQLGKAARGEGDWPTTIEVPFARHSPLPELQDLVKVFNPHSISPNTLQPPLKGLDYYLLPELFAHYLSNDAVERLTTERDNWFHGRPIPTMANLLVPPGNGEDSHTPGGSHSAIGRGRRSHAADHASRLVLTPQNLNATLASLPPDVAKALKQALQANKVGGVFGMNSSDRGNDDDGYDTDEEREVRRRGRNRRVSGRVEDVKPDTGENMEVDLEWTKVEHSEKDDLPGAAIEEEWIKVESRATSTAAPGTRTSGSSRLQSPFLRGATQLEQRPTGVNVDKDHLRRIIAAPCPDKGD